MEQAKAPSLWDIQPQDLKKTTRLESLYRQAVKAGWIEHSEANILNFACAALRANRLGGRVGAIFVGLVKKRLWNYVTQEQEVRALAVLNRFRCQYPTAFLSTEPECADHGGCVPEIIRPLLGNIGAASKNANQRQVQRGFLKLPSGVC